MTVVHGISSPCHAAWQQKGKLEISVILPGEVHIKMLLQLIIDTVRVCCMYNFKFAIIAL